MEATIEEEAPPTPKKSKIVEEGKGKAAWQQVPILGLFFILPTYRTQVVALRPYRCPALSILDTMSFSLAATSAMFTVTLPHVR